MREQAAAIGLWVRLIAPDAAHPAPRSLPWEKRGMLLQAGGGIVVDRAGETLAEVTAWLWDWQEELQTAERERQQLDQQRRQEILETLRHRLEEQ